MQRPEYPRPQMVRTDWINLNGTWEYETDRVNTGVDRKLFETSAVFRETIEVPFCRESPLSGIGDPEFCAAVWYRKKLVLPENWADKRILLHIGACDYVTTLYVNGKEAGKHIGGMVSFTFDLTEFLDRTPGAENVVTLYAFDDVRSGNQPGGKQCHHFNSYGCYYTRTTGIWQTVWLEAVEPVYIQSTKYYPDVDAKTLTVEALAPGADGMTLTAKAFYDGKEVGSASAVVHNRSAILTLPLSELHLWEIGNGRLYDLTLTLGKDEVRSYFGMRSIGLRDGIFYLNGKPVFQRLVLDQGFYPDGIYTAPTEQALIDDIKRSMDVGFNGARLHQKIFEPLFLYHCDRLGYIVWGEHGNWGLEIGRPQAWKNFLPEWVETVNRDFNHPAVIGWCPLNETWVGQDDDFVRAVAAVTRSLDPTRLFIETSGWIHVKGLSDMIDVHDYTQNPEEFGNKLVGLENGGNIRVHTPAKWNLPEEYGHVTFLSEYGGIHWNADDTSGNSWGYGTTPKSPEEFIARFRGLAEKLLFNPSIGALCYTQLTDVEQEQNGLYTYDRRPKFDPAIFRAILTQVAAIEAQSAAKK